MSWSSKSVDFITLFTEDLERSKAFYQDVFGLRLIFEDENSAVFRFANTSINVLRADAAAVIGIELCKHVVGWSGIGWCGRSRLSERGS